MNTLKEFFDSPAGREAKAFLIDESKKINNIQNVKEYSAATAQALELKATKKAAQILTDILSKIMTLDNLKEKVVKNNYV